MTAPEAPSAAPAAAGPRPTPPPPEDLPTREVRFAVVMYGGVSLCIYINGIAQELLHMVRATAGDENGFRYPDDELEPVERVYRALGRRLRARFSVDILSGTSAGGINAIYLAKALANDQGIQQLKQLWISEGDIAKLINDAYSTRGTGLPTPDAPEALLNGQRMYQKLLMAFDGMDGPGVAPPEGTEPRRALVSELDLFVTATDIAGVPRPIRLSDGVVHERRHRGVFHFRYRADGAAKAEPDDFGRDYNPFLAFAARCTSAFPFAFEPMRLEDVDAVLETLDGRRGRSEGRASDARWDIFLEPFAAPEGSPPSDPRKRSFGDGGYLDNKPFSYASEALLQREADLPVERKLVYVEPKPEHPERDPVRDRRPDAIENVLAATVGLPRYETIREDLERVMARNRLTERVRTLTRAVEEDIPAAGKRQTLEPAAEWGNRYLETMIEEHGLAYGSYHRLRVAVTTDWLARIVAKARGVGDGSDLVLAIRSLVGAWRDQRFTLKRASDGDERASENRFLLDFDLAFRIRRMRYLLGKANWLHDLDHQATEAIRQIASRAAAPGAAVSQAPVVTFAARPLTDDEQAEFRAELAAIKRALLPAYEEMRRRAAALERSKEHSPLHAAVMRLSLDAGELTALLKLSGEQRQIEAHLLVTAEERQASLDALSVELRGLLIEAREPASRDVDALLHPRLAAPGPSVPRQLARQVLWHYYQHYADYDMVSFPILYSTEAGEQETVDVIRISPEDATYFFDEKDPAEPRRKLAGTSLFSFGGFLQESWRVNDMLWGRLDGAERIICSLLRGDEHETLRERLLADASLAVIEEEFRSANRAEVKRLLSESLVSVAAGRPAATAVSRIAGQVGNEQVPVRLEKVFGECLDEKELMKYFAKGYEVNRDLEPRAALEALARGSRVVGRMLEGITARHAGEGRSVRWVTRAGSWFWSLVQVAIPRSLSAMLMDHWMGLFYTFAVLLVVLGLFARGAVLTWGLGILAGGLAMHLIVLVFRDVMRRRGRVAALGGAVLLVGALALMAAGAAAAAEQPRGRALLERAHRALGVPAWTGEHTLQALSVVFGLLILAGTLWGLTRNRWKGALPGGFRLPMLAAEFPEDAAALARLSRAVDPAGSRKLADVVVRGLYFDYLFIAGYWLIFLLYANRQVGAALAAAPDPASVLLYAGALAGVAGTAAALMDVLENVRMHEAFTAFRGREEGWMADGIRGAATVKWGLAFGTVVLLSFQFLAVDALESQLLGIGWLGIGFFGLWASVRKPVLLQAAFPLLGAGLAAAAYVLAAV